MDWPYDAGVVMDHPDLHLLSVEDWGRLLHPYRTRGFPFETSPLFRRALDIGAGRGIETLKISPWVAQVSGVSGVSERAGERVVVSSRP